jgi:hypothetical protein
MGCFRERRKSSIGCIGGGVWLVLWDGLISIPAYYFRQQDKN